jgi:DNA (cytosine-5)-methyltransferase 1
VDPRTLRILSLCSGVGALDLGVKLAYPESRVLCYVEREAFACEVLVSRMEDETLAEAPIWTDVSTFDGRPWRGLVECVTAGFPCQPWSSAGSLAKTNDPRWLWPAIARIVGEVQPEYVFLENVRGLIHGGLEHVLGSLATFGFDAEWDCFTAAEAGSPQVRERLFILAHANDCGQPWASGRVPRYEDPSPWPDPRDRRQVFPPGRRDTTEWGEVPESFQPEVCRVPDGITPRVDRIKAIANAVVPAVAAVAFRTLHERLI